MGLHKDLHTSTESQDQMEGRFFLDVVVTQCATIFKLLTSKDKTLLVWWNSFLILNLSFEIDDGIAWFHFKSDGLSSEGLHEDLHTSTKSQNQMERRFLLDVVVTQCAAIFKLLTSEDKTLLVWWDSFLILNLSFDIVDGITWFHFEEVCRSL